MRTNHLIKCLTIAAFLSMGINNAIKADNITIWDGNGTLNSSEVGEVEPGMQTTSNWWLDGFEYDAATHKLSIKSGGYNFLQPPTAGDYGDIFIKTGSAAPIFGDIDGSTGNRIVSNTTGYNYVFDIDMPNHSYKLYAINSSSTVKTAYEPLNQGSTPWRYESGGIFEGSGSSVNFSSSTLSGFDLSFLNGQEFWAHNTMQCGNDNLMGHYAPVPEPATMLLFGTGLAGLAGARLRRKKR